MTALPADAARPAGALEPDGFEIAYVTEDSVEQRMPLADAFAVPFELGMPVRRFTFGSPTRHAPVAWR